MYVSVVALACFATLLPLGACVKGSPDQLIPEQWRSSIPLAWDSAETRAHFMSGQNMSAQYIWTMDQIMDGEGTINVCMGWGANRTLPETERNHIEEVYRKHFNEWLRLLPCYDGFPFKKVDINVVGWAAHDKALLGGPLDGVNVYTGFLDDHFDMPTCDPGCSWDKHPDGNYTGCSGGRDNRFHQILALDPSWGDYNMGAASGFGVTISLFGWETVGSKQDTWPILLHELGHTFGFPDYIDTLMNKTYSTCSVFWRPDNTPAKFVMQPGSGGRDIANQLTEMEGWMLRHFWSRLSRVRGWQNDTVSWPPPRHCDKLETEG